MVRVQLHLGRVLVPYPCSPVIVKGWVNTCFPAANPLFCFTLWPTSGGQWGGKPHLELFLWVQKSSKEDRKCVHCGRGRSSLTGTPCPYQDSPVDGQSSCGNQPNLFCRNTSPWLNPQRMILWPENTVLAQAEDSMDETDSYGHSSVVK